MSQEGQKDGIDDSEIANRGFNISILYKNASYKTWLIFFIAFVLAVIYAQGLPVYAIFLSRMLEGIEHHPTNDGAFANAATKANIMIYCWAAVIFVAQTIGTGMYLAIGRYQSQKWKIEFYKSLIEKPVSFYDKRNPSSLSNEVEIYARNVEDASGMKLGVALYLFFWLMGGFVIAFIGYNQIFWVWLIAIPVMWGTVAMGYWTSYNTVIERQKAYTVASGISEEAFDGIKTVIAFNKQEEKANEYCESMKNDKQIIMDISLVQGLCWSFSTGLTMAMSGISFYLSAKLIDDGDENWITGHNIQPDDYILFIISLVVGLNNAGMLVPIVHYIQEGITSANRMDVIMKMDNKEQGDQDHDVQGHVEFRDVSFAYPTRPNNPVLQNISFQVDKGQFLGIAGETGSGKSTVIQLLEKFYSPSNGKILIDGQDLALLETQQFRRQIGYVSQEPILFSTSIKHNIKLGEKFTSAQIKQACEAACAADFIDLFPAKYKTFVGQKGSSLSGGQKQRIALARLFLRNYNLIIIDEATSALDYETEAKIVTALKNKYSQASMIAIAQRLSTIVNADNILVLQKGKLIQQGKHADLMNDKEGMYYVMQSAQGVSKVHTQYQQPVDEKSVIEEQSKMSESAIGDAVILEDEPTPIQEMQLTMMLLMEIFKYWPLFTFAFVASIVSGGTFTAWGYLAAQGLRSLMVSPHRQTHASHRQWGFYTTGAILIVSFTLIFVFTARAGAQFTEDLRKKCIQALLYKDMAFFDVNSSGELSSRLGTDCRQASNLGGTVLSINMLSTTSIIIGLVFASLYDSVQALIFLGYAPLITFIMLSSEHIKHSKSGINKSTESLVSDTLTNIKTVKALQIEQRFITEFETRCKESNKGLFTEALIKGAIMASFCSTLIAILATIQLVGAQRVENNSINREDLLVCVFVLIGVSWTYYILAPILADGVVAVSSIRNLIRIFMKPPVIDAKDQSKASEGIQGQITFDSVKFEYPSRRIPVLKGLSFQLEKGQSCGICGTTGSGKSTTIQLLMRFYDVTGGSIKLDGVNIQDFNPSYLRERIAWVGQEPLLFEGSVADNIRFGKPDATDDEVREAAIASQADEFISQSSEGYKLAVGIRGNKLSGGQKQRVAIARGLIKRAPILLMDEATSALDGKTEKKVKEAIDQRYANADDKPTMVIIAHRLSTIMNCDKIVVMELGEVVEEGSHQELINKGGVYSGLFRLSGLDEQDEENQ